MRKIRTKGLALLLGLVVMIQPLAVMAEESEGASFVFHGGAGEPVISITVPEDTAAITEDNSITLKELTNPELTAVSQTTTVADDTFWSEHSSEGTRWYGWQKVATFKVGATVNNEEILRFNDGATVKLNGTGLVTETNKYYILRWDGTTYSDKNNPKVMDGNLQFNTDYTGVYTVISCPKTGYELYPDYVAYAALFGYREGFSTVTLSLECGHYYDGDPEFVKTMNEKGAFYEDIPFKVVETVEDGEALPAGTNYVLKADIEAFNATNTGQNVWWEHQYTGVTTLEGMKAARARVLNDYETLRNQVKVSPGVMPVELEEGTMLFAEDLNGPKSVIGATLKQETIPSNVMESIQPSLSAVLNAEAAGYSSETKEVYLTSQAGGTEKLTVDGTVGILLPYPDGCSKDDSFKIFHYTGNAWVEETNITLEEEGIRCKVTSLSPFSVAYKKGGNTQSGSTSTNSGSSGSSSGAQTVTVASAKTGDAAMPMLWAMVALSGCVGAVVVSRRRHTEK